MADYTPVFVSADHWTATTSTAVVGGQLLQVTGSNTVGATTSATAVIGVAGFDAPVGAKVTVHGLGGLIHTLTAGASITAGNSLKATTGGQVAPWVSGTDLADQVIGVALTTQATTGAPVRVLGTR